MAFPHDDVIDTRDLIEWRDALHEEAFILWHASYDGPEDDYSDFEELDDEEKDAALLMLEPDDRDALQQVNDAESEIEDFEYGATLIAESYFTEYAREYADDIGAVNRDATWPYTCIDWERAAAELQVDYTIVTIDGRDYYVR